MQKLNFHETSSHLYLNIVPTQTAEMSISNLHPRLKIEIVFMSNLLNSKGTQRRWEESSAEVYLLSGKNV